MIVLIATLTPEMCFSYTWREGDKLPTDGLKNPYGWNEFELSRYRTLGLGHALEWPVDVTGVLLPERPLKKGLKAASSWLGLHRFPESEGEGAYYVPFPDGSRPTFR